MKDKKKADTAAEDTEVVETTEDEEADAEFEASLDGLSDEEKEQKRAERDGSHVDNEADDQAQLAKEKKIAEERADRAEKTLANKRFQESERRRKAAEEGGEGEGGEAQPLTEAGLEARLAEEREKTLKDSQSERIQEIAAEIGESETQADLIVAIHKNRSWPSGQSLRDQLEDAKAIATRRRTASKQVELARAIKAKGTATRDAGGAHRDGMETVAPKLAPDVTASLKTAGFILDPKSKIYKKKLPNGKFLFKDLKKKRTWIA